MVVLKEILTHRKIWSGNIKYGGKIILKILKMNIMLYKRKINTTLLIVVLSFFCACQSDRRKTSPVVDDTKVAEKTIVEETEVAKMNGRDSLWIKDSIA